MKNYTSLRSLLSALKSNELFESGEFTFKGFRCFWSYSFGFEPYLRCDPCTERQYRDYERMSVELRSKDIFVVLS